MSLVKRFMQEEEGATMVEYGIMVALIAAVCIAAVALIGTNLDTLFGSVSTEIAAADGKVTTVP